MGYSFVRLCDGPRHWTLCTYKEEESWPEIISNIEEYSYILFANVWWIWVLASVLLVCWHHPNVFEDHFVCILRYAECKDFCMYYCWSDLYKVLVSAIFVQGSNYCMYSISVLTLNWWSVMKSLTKDSHFNDCLSLYQLAVQEIV
jgi:hypothetical protein